MSQQSNEFDLVFLSIFGSPTYDGELYTIDKFKPLVMLPMHYGGRESIAERFVILARSKFPKTEFWYPLNKSDRFLYKKFVNLIRLICRKRQISISKGWLSLK